MSTKMFEEKLEQAEERLQSIRRVLNAKRRRRKQLIARVAHEPDVAGDVAQLDGEISVLREVEPTLVASRDEARRNLAHRRRWEEKHKAKVAAPQ